MDEEDINLNDLLGVFVTAKLKGGIGSRRGWVVEIDPFIIQGQSGEKYKCEGKPVIVINPPGDTNTITTSAFNQPNSIAQQKEKG